MKQLERHIESAFVRKCKKCGVWQVKVGVDALPDRLVLARGRPVWVEFKRPGGKPRPNQVKTINRLRRLGYEVKVIDNSEEAIALVEEISEESD